MNHRTVNMFFNLFNKELMIKIIHCCGLNIVVLFFLYFITTPIVSAQDIHFSQFHASPLNINPAFTGSYDGQFRLMGTYRTQWNSVTVPYKTISFGVDAKDILRQDKLGGGILINNDKAGDSQLNTFQFLLSGSYRMVLDANEKHHIFGGLQIGIHQLSINYSELKFDSQYNGFAYISSSSNNESFGNEGGLSPLINLGAMWQYEDGRTKGNFGLSMYNINGPNQSFYNDAPVKLDSRLNIHGSAQFPISSKFEVLPSMLFMKQGTFSELMIGTFGKLILNDDEINYRAVYLGSWLRSKDAGCFVAAMDYGTINVGLSYDMNYSELKQASNKRGGFEISFRYIIKEKIIGRAKYSICPSFL